ncbi:hypothetical protein SAMN02799624_02392 [Paenibacillus sp. UNC496MF]|uniref:hypothetical protein n=1 Tax=Paenibacillus sp. UNC496MF TaxID=1502753 RepID=UPI0008F2FB24|nr:hypothetical protein [Paenibacillus sp. UNC496MF]SFI86137.1 hypothetical protein SAMN02799624_02392 [Paenibacillus sp. UNC496MF]
MRNPAPDTIDRETSASRRSRLPGRPAVLLFVAHFAYAALLVSVACALIAGRGLSPVEAGTLLLPGLLLAIGAYVPDNMLSRSAWISVRPGLALLAAALLGLLAWSGADATAAAVAMLGAGCGFAGVTLGAAGELNGPARPEPSHAARAPLPSRARAPLPRPRLYGGLGGAAFGAAFLLLRQAAELRPSRAELALLLAAVLAAALAEAFGRGREEGVFRE